jgi:hypothetical protein
MRLRSATVVAGLALGLMSGAAKAELLHFQYVGSSDFSFNLDSSPTPLGSGSYYNVFGFNSDHNGEQSNTNPSFAVYFYIQDQGGGGLATSGILNLIAHGDQVFSGSTSAPQFSPGVFHLFDQTSNMPSTLTVSVSTVPLPTSAPMFGAALLALGIVGYGLKRKEAASAT